VHCAYRKCDLRCSGIIGASGSGFFKPLYSILKLFRLTRLNGLRLPVPPAVEDWLQPAAGRPYDAAAAQIAFAISAMHTTSELLKQSLLDKPLYSILKLFRLTRLNGLRLPVPPAVEDWLQHSNSHFVNEYLYGDSISPRLAGFSSSIGPLVLTRTQKVPSANS
jgi:hypothetical protein